MSFVEDHGGVFRQHRTIVAVAQREISKEEMVINNHDVALFGAFAHARDEAGIEVGTLLAQTTFRTSINMTPEGDRFRNVGELCAVTGRRNARPVANLFEIVDLVHSVQDWGRLSSCQSIQTEIVDSAFHVSGGERFGQNALEKRNVFHHQLFLEILGASGNNYAAVPTQCGGDSGNKIGECLAGAGASFDDEVPLFF